MSLILTFLLLICITFCICDNLCIWLFVAIDVYNIFCLCGTIFVIIYKYFLWQFLSYMCGNLYLICMATHVHEIFCFCGNLLYNILQLATFAKYRQNICKWDLVLTVSSRRTQRCNRYLKRSSHEGDKTFFRMSFCTKKISVVLT